MQLFYFFVLHTFVFKIFPWTLLTNVYHVLREKYSRNFWITLAGLSRGFFARPAISIKSCSISGLSSHLKNDIGYPKLQNFVKCRVLKIADCRKSIKYIGLKFTEKVNAMPFQYSKLTFVARLDNNAHMRMRQKS